MPKNPVAFSTTWTGGPVRVTLIDRRTGKAVTVDIQPGCLVQLIGTIVYALKNLELGFDHHQRQKMFGDEETSGERRLHVVTHDDQATFAIWESGVGAKKLASTSMSLRKLRKSAEKTLDEVLEFEGIEAD